jgi:hypothetical protein
VAETPWQQTLASSFRAATSDDDGAPVTPDLLAAQRSSSGATLRNSRATIPGAMPLEVLQRDQSFTGPRNQGDIFRLTKREKTAVCELWSHQLGWELRLTAGGEFLRSHVCRSHEEVFGTFEAWKAAMIGKGWR